MAGNRDYDKQQAHFESDPEEDMGWQPWAHGPWGRGPRGPWGRGPRGPRGPWGFSGPFGGWFGRGFGPGFDPGFGPGFGGPFGGFGGFGPEARPEWESLFQVGFDVVRLARAGVLASGGDAARLGQLRGILERTRDELNAFLGQSKPSGAENPTAGATPTGDGPSSVV
jgi:hypothetical protein